MSPFFQPMLHVLTNFFIFTLVNSATIWYEPMQDTTGFSNWIQSSPQPTQFDFQSQSNGCPTTDWNVIINDCWRVCGQNSYIYRSSSTIDYEDISLEFDIDPWSMTNANEYCDIEWSADTTNWNLIDRSTNSAHIVDRTFSLHNSSWNQPNINIRINVNSAYTGSCCYMSHFALTGTLTSPTTTSYISTTVYTTTSVPTGSNFFIDNDWVLSDAYPFPVNLCIQTSPDLVQREVTYYKCSDDGQQVTKYKWIQQVTDCSDFSTADEMTTYTKNIAGSSCDLHHFECEGSDNYVTANFYLSFSTECTNLDDALFSTSVASNICYCESTTSSLMLTCDSNDAIMFNYTGNSCSSQLPAQRSLGKAGSPTFFITYGFAYVCAEMAECVVDSVNSVTTKAPTTSTTLKVPPPTTSTRGGSGGVDEFTTSDGYDVENPSDKSSIFDIVEQQLKYIIIGGLIILICCILTCICCFHNRKKRAKESKFVKPSMANHFGVSSSSHVLPTTPPPNNNNNSGVGVAMHQTQIIQNPSGEDVEMILVEGAGLTTNAVDMIAMSPSANSKFSSGIDRDKHIKGQDTIGFGNNLKNVVAGIDMVMDDMINEMNNENDGNKDGDGHVTGGFLVTAGGPNDYMSAAQRNEMYETNSNNAENGGYELEQSVDANSDANSDADSVVNLEGGTAGGPVDDNNVPAPPMPPNMGGSYHSDEKILVGITPGGNDSGDDNNAPPPPAPPSYN